jgi:WD40 repeat protein
MRLNKQNNGIDLVLSNEKTIQLDFDDTLIVHHVFVRGGKRVLIDASADLNKSFTENRDLLLKYIHNKLNNNSVLKEKVINKDVLVLEEMYNAMKGNIHKVFDALANINYIDFEYTLDTLDKFEFGKFMAHKIREIEGALLGVSDDGTKLLIFDNDIKVYDTISGTYLSSWEEYRGGKYTTFSPDGSKVVICSYNELIVKVMDVYSGKCLHTIPHVSKVHTAVFCGNNTLIFGSGNIGSPGSERAPKNYGNCIVIYDLEKGKTQHTITFDPEHPPFI